MAKLNQAIRMALHYGEENLGVRDIFGQDVGDPLGGVFTVTQGLKTTWNSPLDERGIISMAMGIAMTGERCVAEIQFCDYLLKIAGNTNWVSKGNYTMPMVVMTPVGAGIRGSVYHSHSFDSWASRLPGWKVVMPSNSLDAYGLMLSAIADPNPVKALMRVRSDDLIPGEPEDQKLLSNMIDQPVTNARAGWKPKWPKLEDYRVPIGEAKVTRAGDQITVVSWGRHVLLCNKVADTLREQGLAIEVIDLRSIYPYDWQAIKRSVQKTRRVLFVNEDTEVTNFAEHLAYRITQEMFYEIEAPPRVLAGKNLPGIGLHPNLEDNSVPQSHEIESAVRELIAEVP